MARSGSRIPVPGDTERTDVDRTGRRPRCGALFRGRSGRVGPKCPQHPDQKWKSHIYAGLAGTGVSPRRHVRRRRHQLRGLLGGRQQDRVVPAARRRFRDGGGAERDRCLRPPCLSARGDARAAVRVPGARTVRAAARNPLQLGEAAARSVRAGGLRADPVGRGGVRLSVRPPRRAQRPRLRAAHDDVGGGQPVLRLGRRPAAPYGLPPHGDLRGPCEGPDHAPSGTAEGAARHLRGAGPPGGHRTSDRTRCDGDRADAGAPVRPGPPAGGRGARQLLGLQHHRLLRPAQRVRLPRRPR